MAGAPHNPYRPETSPEEIGGIVNDSLKRYFENEPELPLEKTKTDYEIERDALGTETESNVMMAEISPATATEEIESMFELTVGAAEPMLEHSTETKLEPTIERGPELYESYELPVNDLELLLAELEGDPLETSIEVNQEVEKIEDAERPL